jgi:hypothetical protein
MSHCKSLDAGYVNRQVNGWFGAAYMSAKPTYYQHLVSTSKMYERFDRVHRHHRAHAICTCEKRED